MRVNGWYSVMCEDCAKKLVSNDEYYKRIGIKWRRASDGKIFSITKDTVTEQ